MRPLGSSITDRPDRHSHPSRADAYVGDVAGVSMAATIVVLLLQVPVWIAAMTVRIVLPSLGVVSDEVAARLMVPTAIVLESAFVAGVVVWVRGQLRAQAFARDVADDLAMQPPPPFVTEATLETAVLCTMVGTIAWTWLLGLGSAGTHVAVLVVDGFAAAFMATLVLVRWAMTREVRLRGMAALAAAIVSAWSAWQGVGP